MFFSVRCLRSDGHSSSSNTFRISSRDMKLIVDRLLTLHNRDSTKRTYLAVWRKFNNFVIKLDIKPPTWEERTAMFMADMIANGAQSSSVKSYISAIKRILADDGYTWDDNIVLLSSLTRACKLKNDHVRTRLPIGYGLMELLLFEIARQYVTLSNQPYLCVMYQAIIALGYYGLLRAGELTFSQHVIKAKDVHVALNKPKMLLVLYSSKTHDRSSYPQKIRVTVNENYDSGFRYNTRASNMVKRYFCPFDLLHKYLTVRGEFDEDSDPLFIFRGGAVVMPSHARQMLRKCLKQLGLNENLYDLHSLCIGRASDMVHKFHYSVEEVKRAGRWKSSCVYRYIRN